MKKQFIKDLNAGDSVEDLFAVKLKKPPVGYRSGKEGMWFSLQIADRSGEMTARVWGRSEKEAMSIYAPFKTGDVILIRGRVSEFDGKLQISIEPERGDFARKSNDYDSRDFVQSSGKDIGAMLSEFRVICSGTRNPHIKLLIDSFLDDAAFMESFSKAPAAMQRHQNYVGGLLEHTLNLIKICMKLAEIHNLDKDLLVSGAFFHDIGKTREFEVGTSIDVSREGMLVGHIPIGYKIVADRIEKLGGFPDELGFKILHMVLSHQGRLEYGSPKTPQFPEAIALYYADECDAKLEYAVRLKKEANTEDPWIWTKDFGHIYLE